MQITYLVTIDISRTDDLPFDETDPHFLKIKENYERAIGIEDQGNRKSVEHELRVISVVEQE